SSRSRTNRCVRIGRSGERSRRRGRHRRARIVRRVVDAAPTHVSGRDRAFSALVWRQPVHLRGRWLARRCRPDRRGGRAGRSGGAGRSAAAGARAHRHRDRLRDDGAVSHRAARRARAHRDRSRRWAGIGRVNPQAHFVILPIVLPFAAGIMTLLVDERHLAAKAAISVVMTLTLVAAAVMLLRFVDVDGTQVYRVGDWPAPFGIVLVADRLSAALVLLASGLCLACLVFALARWHREGPRFHTLVHFLLMGVNGAFLTGDLFNLFVF